MTRALITGVTGQDGGYLSELLLSLGTEVIGLARAETDSLLKFRRAFPDVDVKIGDVTSRTSLADAFQACAPDEVFNLAAISQPSLSWINPETVGDVTGLGPLRIIQIVMEAGADTRICQASSSEIFAGGRGGLVDESARIATCTPYGSAKAFAHSTIQNFRDHRGLFACNAILFNHESPRRSPAFVTRKISKGVAAIALGMQSKLVLGNIDTCRDWGHAADYVDAMVRMVRHSEPADYVIASGKTHSVRQFLQLAFAEVGIGDWRPYVEISENLYRPSEAPPIAGDSSRALTVLGWSASRSFEDLVSEMVRADVDGLKRGDLYPNHD